MIRECPLCGEDKDFEYASQIEDREGIPISLVCGSCGCSSGMAYMSPSIYHSFATKKFLISEHFLEMVAEITGWNKRAGDE